MKYQIYLPMAKEIVDAIRLYNLENHAGTIQMERHVARMLAEAVEPWMEPKGGTRCDRCGQWVPDRSTMVWNTKTGTGMHYDCWLEGVRECRAWEDDFMKGESRGKEKSKPESGAPGETDLSAVKSPEERGVPRDQPQADPGGLPPHRGSDCSSGGDDLPGTGSPAKDGGAGDGGGSGVKDSTFTQGASVSVAIPPGWIRQPEKGYRAKIAEVYVTDDAKIEIRYMAQECLDDGIPTPEEDPPLPESNLEIPMPKVKAPKKQKTVSCQTRAWIIYNLVMDEVEVGTPNGEIVDLIYDQIQEYETDLIEITASDLKRKTRKWSMGGYQPEGKPGRATLPKPPKGGSGISGIPSTSKPSLKVPGQSGMNATPEPLWKLFIDQFVRAEKAVDEIIETFCLDAGKENQDELMGILRKVILQPRDCGGVSEWSKGSTESGPLWRDFLYVVLKKDQYKDTLTAFIKHVNEYDDEQYEGETYFLADAFEDKFTPEEWEILKEIEADILREEKEVDGA